MSSDGLMGSRSVAHGHFMGSTTVGSDGSVFIQTGHFSSDGSTRLGSSATGLGAVFNQDEEEWPRKTRSGLSLDDDDF